MKSLKASHYERMNHLVDTWFVFIKTCLLIAYGNDIHAVM